MNEQKRGLVKREGRAKVAADYRYTAHKLNGCVYHDNWLHYLLISASIVKCTRYSPAQ